MQTSLTTDALLDLVDAGDWTTLAESLARLHPVDVAELIHRAHDDDQQRIFTLVSDAQKPDVLAELETVVGAEIVEALSNAELSDIIEDMSPDDAADVLGDLPEDRSRQVLDLMERDESEDVRHLLLYPEDTAGGIMTTDVVALHGTQTVQAALDAIAYLDIKEKFYMANIVDEHGVFLGYVDIWDLLRERNRHRLIGELARTAGVVANVNMDQEEVARLIRKYDLAVIPVLDDAKRLVGRITADDVLDVLTEEASEDIFRLAGSDDVELETTSALRSCFVRLPWLFITLLGGFATTLILDHFRAHVAGMLVLVAFVPILLAMGGNTGIQSSTLVVRSLALGSFDRRHVARLLMKEVLTGAIMGCICGAIIGAWAGFVIGRGPAHPGAVPLPALHLAGVVALALFSAMTFATAFGALVPILLDRMKVDPAVASGPFVTIANDISALLIYFGVTVLLVSHLL